MTNAEQRIVHLEQLVKNLLDTIARMQAAIAALKQSQSTVQSSPYSGGGGGMVYTIGPVVISANSSVASQTVYALMNGSSTALSGTYTVYNQMHSATVATSGLTIVVGANPDGTFSVITQSC